MRTTGLGPAYDQAAAMATIDLTNPATARENAVFQLWCALTGTDSTEFDTDDRAAFFARPQMAALCATPDSVLNDAASVARKGRSLPLERWLAAVQVVRPAAKATH
ncbi:hypothetical protein [Fodinicola acaciae]|uniref:hypothetical protein n=1 Tax=Fodinicola acaciae TaxID=2681555 RepID=UPI0013D11842|nr:hypothetical protein [Fodinicola acaciae]